MNRHVSLNDPQTTAIGLIILSCRILDRPITDTLIFIRVNFKELSSCILSYLGSEYPLLAYMAISMWKRLVIDWLCDILILLYHLKFLAELSKHVIPWILQELSCFFCVNYDYPFLFFSLCRLLALKVFWILITRLRVISIDERLASAHLLRLNARCCSNVRYVSYPTMLSALWPGWWLGSCNYSAIYGFYVNHWRLFDSTGGWIWLINIM
jgi:hypothetical protein